MSSKMSSARDMYQQVASDSLSVETVFSALSDNKSLSLFNIIAIMSSHASDGQPTGEILISRMNLTRRQYYTRINQLRDAGLTARKSTKFVLTSLGSVVYETHITIALIAFSSFVMSGNQVWAWRLTVDLSDSSEMIQFVHRLRA